MRVLFIQVFGMQGQAGGGTSKIFRSLIANAPAVVGVLVYGTKPPKWNPSFEEIFVRERINWGRLERSRLAPACLASRTLSWTSSRRRCFRAIGDWNPDHVHLHLHGTAFIHGADWCQQRGVPFSVSVHDDIRHLSTGDMWAAFIERKAGEAWRHAVNRFVISREIGEEYCRRYGARPWIEITDGLESVSPVVRPSHPNRLHVYFAGAVNLPYEPNLQALMQALKLLKLSRPELATKLILRGGRHFEWEDPSAPEIEVRPFGTPQEVTDDLQGADVLYLPLSIDPTYADFARFSLSTKMVMYLGAGLPIFYHGPGDSAAGQLLAHANACAGCTSNDPSELLAALNECIQRRDVITKNALRLATERFALGPIRKRFWDAISNQ